MNKDDVRLDLKGMLYRSLRLEGHFDKHGDNSDKRSIKSIRGITNKLLLKHVFKTKRRTREKATRA